MTTALAVAKTTVARSPVNYVRNGMSYCQTFAGNFWETAKGRPTPNSYATADAARRASKIVSKDWKAAPPGAYHYFAYSVYGHVGVSLGSGLMASATGWGTNAVANLGKNVLVHRVSDYAKHLTYYGWSYTNGARERITGLTDHSAPALAANQRQVKADKFANVRDIPDQDGKLIQEIKPNTIVTISGYAVGETVGGINTWYGVRQADGKTGWSWAGGWTRVSTSGLTDITPLPVEPPKVFYPVTVRYLNETDDIQVHEIELGKLLPEPTAPERDAFLFNGWARDGQLFDFTTPITSPITIEALWSAKPIPVEPEPEPGEPVDPAPVDPGVPSEPGVPAEPTVPTTPPSKPSTPVKTGGVIALVLAGIAGLVALLVNVFGG